MESSGRGGIGLTTALLDQLLDEATRLRTAYVEARQSMGLPNPAPPLLEAGQEIIRWIETSAQRLRFGPEFRISLDEVDVTKGLLEEFDARILRLAELRRLTEA